MTSRKFFSDLLKFADKDARAQKHIYNYERGYLTYDEAMRAVIDLYMSHNIEADKNVKAWYIDTYHDEAGQDIDDNITFEEVYHAMKMGDNFYETIGAGDSVIRERIFEELSNLYKVSYDDIYTMWLKAT
jgi:hypothetical protein